MVFRIILGWIRIDLPLACYRNSSKSGDKIYLSLHYFDSLSKTLEEVNRKKGKDFGLCCFYACFLSTSMPTIAIAIIIAITAMTMYVISSTDVAKFDAGAAVGA